MEIKDIKECAEYLKDKVGIIIILLSISGITYYKYNNGVVLTLLHDNSPRQMIIMHNFIAYIFDVSLVSWR